MENPVADSIISFLRQFPPFTSLDNSSLTDIALSCKIIYLEKNEILFMSGTPTHDSFYVVKDGAIGLSVTSDTEERLIDKCDEGDILGLRPFFAKNNYLMTAKAREECIIYAIPISNFQKYVSGNIHVLNFLLESFASHTRNPYDKENAGKLISENIIYSEQVTDIQYFQPLKYTRNPVTANPEDILKFIAKTMASSSIGSVIIQENQLPVGIITDRDLRNKIATGLLSIDSPASEVMTAPVVTVSENLSLAEAQMVMLKHNIGHLCVTKDGTAQTVVTGIISEHDIVAAQSNTPGILLKQTQRATRIKELKYVREKVTDLIESSMDNNIPVSHISNIVAEINIAIIKRAVELAVQDTGTPPPVRFAWMNVGSQGRKEQLLLTDQDNALVFEDVPAEQYDNVKKYFLDLADKVTYTLNKIGYDYDTYGVTANKPDWCRSVSGWIDQYKTWINNPSEKSIERSTLFFDYDFVYGFPAIEDILAKAITGYVSRNKKFFAYMAADALKNPPPLGFFRQFLVENDGRHKDSFDIKNRALEPLTDAARLISLSHSMREITNTYFRFKKLAELEPKNAELFNDCADAFNVLMRFRTEEGLANNSDGKYLNLNELSKSDRVKLKNCFQPISDIHDHIKNRFSLTYIK